MKFDLASYLKETIKSEKPEEYAVISNIAILMDGLIKPGDIKRHNNSDYSYNIESCKGSIYRQPDYGLVLETHAPEMHYDGYTGDAKLTCITEDGIYYVFGNSVQQVKIEYFDMEAVEAVRNAVGRINIYYPEFSKLGIKPDNQIIVNALMTEYKNAYAMVNAYAKNPELIKENFETKTL